MASQVASLDEKRHLYRLLRYQHTDEILEQSPAWRFGIPMPRPGVARPGQPRLAAGQRADEVALPHDLNSMDGRSR